MTVICRWRRDFSPWSCYCSIDGMCGMRVCEWTRRELTLDIRFTGGDYDPGHSGRNREEKAKPRPMGDSRGGENGAKAMKWNEVFDLPGTGQVSPLECLIWWRAYYRTDTSSCTEHPKWERKTDLCIKLSHFSLSIPLVWECSLSSWRSLSNTLWNVTEVHTLCPKVSLRGPLVFCSGLL